MPNQNLHLPVVTGEITRAALAQADGTLLAEFRSIRGDDFDLIVTTANPTDASRLLAAAAAVKVSGITTVENGTRTLRADIRHIVTLALD
ncbi:hypothetical protein GCM10025867_51470 (plasmid) [Frondihabitans sucicola]|uniref:Uncharacterized protein n=1 Tax=Frondihabitans sucicola TaxID=1268041 RepID=A0ABM8GV44_9MICO|nr:hypothetical protein [Frondihabitans sucicola]BDZ52339.1 hypothetical protein GCM10025867_45800 [Frondihabitans sucicola]BDZ52906.1 hypothetical protein GCM10025867_51470 [Frondihabitans sucicola]